MDENDAVTEKAAPPPTPPPPSFADRVRKLLNGYVGRTVTNVTMDELRDKLAKEDGVESVFVGRSGNDMRATVMHQDCIYNASTDGLKVNVNKA